MEHAASELKRLIHESGLSISEIARQAGVRYQPLQRFVKDINPRYNLVAAEAVYHTLTGRTFIPAAKPSKRGRAAA